MKNNPYSRGASRLTAVLLLLCLLLGALPLAGCGAANAASTVPGLPDAVVPSFPPLPAPRGLRVAVASDLHFDPQRHASAENPQAYEYSTELVSALLWDARRVGASAILLTGDICNGGRVVQHEALAELLRAAEAEGLDVYVLPGNHDLAPTTQTEFAAIYADFGFAEAFSRDPSSLSYCVVRDGLMFLMMDEGGFGAAGYDLPGVPNDRGGEIFLSEATLRWAEAMLEEAARQGLHVIAAGHYNLLSAIGRDPAYVGYYVENGERFTELLQRFGVTLYCSGHVHTRAVLEENGLTELVTEYLLGYPGAFGILDLTDRGLSWTPRRVDVDGWAAETGQTDPILLGYAAWQQKMLLASAEETVGNMAGRKDLNEADIAQATAFFYAVMDAYWRGAISDEREALEAMPGRVAYFRGAEGYAYDWWLRDLIDNATPRLKGFSVPWRQPAPDGGA